MGRIAGAAVLLLAAFGISALYISRARAQSPPPPGSPPPVGIIPGIFVWPLPGNWYVQGADILVVSYVYDQRDPNRTRITLAPIDLSIDGVFAKTVYTDAITGLGQTTIPAPSIPYHHTLEAKWMGAVVQLGFDVLP